MYINFYYLYYSLERQVAACLAINLHANKTITLANILSFDQTFFSQVPLSSLLH